MNKIDALWRCNELRFDEANDIALMAGLAITGGR
jgi:hypothetical protein